MGIISLINELEIDQGFSEGNFAATINYIDSEWAKKIKGFLAFYGIVLTKASEQKYLTYSETEIMQVLKKLQYCKDHSYPVVDENGIAYTYLFDLNNKSFLKIYPDADLANIVPDVLRDKQAIDEVLLSSLESESTPGLTEENYDRYIKLEGVLTNVMQAINGVGYINSEVTNNLIKLISANISCTDNEILFASLVYNQNKSAAEIEAIKSAIGAVTESLSQGGAPTL